jgi:outer membrane protein TolC
MHNFALNHEGHGAVFHHEGREVRKGKTLRGGFITAILLVAATSAHAQTMERLTFQQAIERATRNNPTVAQAAAGIMRAEAILQQVRSSSLPALGLTTAVNFTNPVKFGDQSVVPGVQTQTTPALGYRF